VLGCDGVLLAVWHIEEESVDMIISLLEQDLHVASESERCSRQIE